MSMSSFARKNDAVLEISRTFLDADADGFSPSSFDLRRREARKVIVADAAATMTFANMLVISVTGLRINLVKDFFDLFAFPL